MPHGTQFVLFTHQTYYSSVVLRAQLHIVRHSRPGGNPVPFHVFLFRKEGLWEFLLLYVIARSPDVVGTTWQSLSLPIHVYGLSALFFCFQLKTNGAPFGRAALVFELCILSFVCILYLVIFLRKPPPRPFIPVGLFTVGFFRRYPSYDKRRDNRFGNIPGDKWYCSHR